jgi:hypothetical protein
MNSQGTANLLSFSVVFADPDWNVGERVTYDVSTPGKRENMLTQHLTLYKDRCFGYKFVFTVTGGPATCAATMDSTCIAAGNLGAIAGDHRDTFEVSFLEVGSKLPDNPIRSKDQNTDAWWR